MRTASGALLVAAGLFLFYLIVTGRLSAGLAAYRATVGPQGSAAAGSGTKPTAGGSDSAPTGGAVAGGFNLPALPNLPTISLG
jgi:hypothetical protein